jgi:two-component system, sensor histidine kinase
LSHELRNPLGAICNATQLLTRAAPQAAAARPLAVLERQTKHLARLVDDLLDVARVTTGKVVLQRRVLDLRSILGQVVQQMEPMMEAQGLLLLSSLGSRPLPVLGDPVRLEQVFSNLLTNALKYTPRGGRVALTAESGPSEVKVRVTDNGVGIAADVMPTLFTLFAQADRSLDRAQGGMGIGLTLVRSLLDLHGGSVTANSAGLGRGAEFVVCLPLERAAALDQGGPVRGRPPRLARHILLVEDNPDNRESLQELLAFEGHRVEVAADGPEALARAASVRPEIAIIDIGLPGMDGFEVARRLRASLGPGVVLVALSGYGQPEDRRKATEAGFNAHVTKPAGLPELEALLAPGALPSRAANNH